MSYQQDPYELVLIDGCLRNDRSMQKKLYEKYKDAMYTILYRMLDGEEEACDALQEAFIKVFNGLKGYKKTASLGAWIKVIVIRTGIAKQKKRIHFEDIDSVSSEKQIITWDEHLTGEYLEKGIQELPEGYRNVFLMVEVEGYTHKEVAEIMNISPGTSKSQLYHAKKRLQQSLKELMDP